MTKDKQSFSAMNIRDICTYRSLLIKILVGIWVVVIIDITFRPQVVKTPSQLLFTLGFSGIKKKIDNLSMSERAEYVEEYCNSTTINARQKQNEDVFYFLQSPKAGVKSLFICLPKRMATKSVFDTLNQAYGSVCNKASCRSRSQKTDSDTVKIVFTRHPFDRLIIGYRHNITFSNINSKSLVQQNHQRKLLLSRRKPGKPRYKGNYHFKEYLKNHVIEHQSILPIAQECGVCDVSYDLVYDLDQGLQQLSVVGQAVGLDIDPK